MKPEIFVGLEMPMDEMRPDYLIDHICRKLDTPKELVLSKTRKREVIDVRRIIAFVLRYRPQGMTLKWIGIHINKDHSSIIHIEKDMSNYKHIPPLRNKILKSIGQDYMNELICSKITEGHVYKGDQCIYCKKKKKEKLQLS